MLTKWVTVGSLAVLSLILLGVLINSKVNDIKDTQHVKTTTDITNKSKAEDEATNDKLHEANKKLNSKSDDSIIDGVLVVPANPTTPTPDASEPRYIDSPASEVDSPDLEDLGGGETYSGKECESALPYIAVGEQATTRFLSEGIIPETKCPCGSSLILQGMKLIEECY